MSRTLSPAERLDWLQLARSGGVGPRTFFKLLQRFGSARRAFAELPRLAQEAGAEDRWQRCRRHEAEAELAALLEQGCRLIAHGEPDYPRHLAEIADPPPLLTVQGQVELLAAPGPRWSARAMPAPMAGCSPSASRATSPPPASR